MVSFTGYRSQLNDTLYSFPFQIPNIHSSIIIPQSYRVYEAVQGRDPDDWLLADSGFDKVIGGRIFVFGRKSYAQWMSAVKKVFVDGTFRISPPLFEQ
uniref:Uncharacterized protein n=1 Tax=Ditylenchus dipsaci TaxID=166011 RepID=A0A915DNS4_9BILA